LITTSAWFEVEIRKVQLLKAQRTLGVFLQAEIDIICAHMRKGVRTVSSSLQYASWTPARTCDFAEDATALAGAVPWGPTVAANVLEEAIIDLGIRVYI
jgi:hypothetical protein